MTRPGLFRTGGPALRAEGRLLWAGLRDRRLGVVLAVFATLIALAAQVPFSYAVDVGLEAGYGSDLPIIAGFHSPERIRSTDTRIRWTTGRSLIRLPGVGQRALLLKIRLAPVNQEIAQNGPREVELWAGGARLGQLVVRPATGGIYTILIPPSADGSGNQQIELRSTTFVPTGDQRALGAPVDFIGVASAGGPALPAWPSTLAWLGAAAMLWLTLRRIGLAPRTTQAIVLGAALPASLAALLDPLRFAFGAGVALTVASLGWLLIMLLVCAPMALVLAGLALLLPAGVLRALFPTADYAEWGGPGAVALCIVAALLLAGGLRPAVAGAYRRTTPLPDPARRWLLLFAVIVFATHFGGKLYPDSMWGDIGFHSHRFTDVAQGRVMMLSSNRGIEFPYPPALYLLLQPFYLTGIDERPLLRLTGALLDALSPFLIYTIAIYASAVRKTGDERNVDDGCARTCGMSWRRGVLAAGLYAFMAATLMTTWWNFSSHIFTQFAHLLLVATLVVLWRRPATGDPRPTTAVLSPRPSALSPQSSALSPQFLLSLFVLQTFVYLGHFGFWINMSLLGALGLAALLVATLKHTTARTTFGALLGLFVASQAFVALFYYSAYAGLFISQVQTAASAGLTGLANRQAVNRALVWQTLWEAGFRTHFGLFPVPLALCGLALLWPRRRDGRLAPGARIPGPTSQDPHPAARVARWPAFVMLAGTFAVGLVFATLPFLTGSTQATRWLMFSAWAVAVSAALAAQLFWRRGGAGRWMVAAAGGYVLWLTATMWLNALAWRIRPPEPF